MINDLRLLYPGGAPNLCSADFVRILRQVRWAEGWVRYSFLSVGVCVLLGLTVLLLPAVIPTRYVKLLHLPGKPGHVTPSGWFVLAGLAALVIFCLHMYSRLRADLIPYSLPDEVLCRYTIQKAHVTGFGMWARFGDRWSRYERIRWAADGASGLRGTTPYVKAFLSIWLDYDDPVYIGIDPTGIDPPIFLGIAKPAPPVLVREPNNFRAVYLELQERFKTSRRWKGKSLVEVWGVRPAGMAGGQDQ